MSRLVTRLPAAGWLADYGRAALRPDLAAALTIWALVVPQAIAYAQIAGLPPQAGLFATWFITGGGASQSAANDRAGARTPLVSLIVSGLTVLTAIALRAIVISAVVGFINVPALRRIARLRRDSFALAMAAMVGVLVLGVLPGLIVAVAISIGLILSRLSRPGSSQLGRVPGTETYVALGHVPAAQAQPGVLVYRLDAPLLALNAKLVRDQVRTLVAAADPPVRTVVLDLEFTVDLDVTTIDMLAALRRDLAEQGISLWLTGVRHGVRTLLRRSGLTAEIGDPHIHRTVEDAMRGVGS